MYEVIKISAREEDYIKLHLSPFHPLSAHIITPANPTQQIFFKTCECVCVFSSPLLTALGFEGFHLTVDCVYVKYSQVNKII